MVTRPRPSLAVSVPGPPPLGPEVSRPGLGHMGSGFLVDLQPLQPHSSPCHPVSPLHSVTNDLSHLSIRAH